MGLSASKEAYLCVLKEKETHFTGDGFHGAL